MPPLPPVKKPEEQKPRPDSIYPIPQAYIPDNPKAEIKIPEPTPLPAPAQAVTLPSISILLPKAESITQPVAQPVATQTPVAQPASTIPTISLSLDNQLLTAELKAKEAAIKAREEAADTEALKRLREYEAAREKLEQESLRRKQVEAENLKRIEDTLKIVQQNAEEATRQQAIQKAELEAAKQSVASSTAQAAQAVELPPIRLVLPSSPAPVVQPVVVTQPPQTVVPVRTESNFVSVPQPDYEAEAMKTAMNGMVAQNPNLMAIMETIKAQANQVLAGKGLMSVVKKDTTGKQNTVQ